MDNLICCHITTKFKNLSEAIKPRGGGFKTVSISCLVLNSCASGGDSGSPLYLMSDDWLNRVQCLYGVTTSRSKRERNQYNDYKYIGNMYFASVPAFHKWIVKTIQKSYQGEKVDWPMTFKFVYYRMSSLKWQSFEFWTNNFMGWQKVLTIPDLPHILFQCWINKFQLCVLLCQVCWSWHFTDCLWCIFSFCYVDGLHSMK